MFRTIRNNPTHAIVWVIVHGFLIGAAAVSFKHIVLEADRLGVHDWQRFTVPFLIDGIAILGKIGRSHRFDIVTQRAGLVLMVIGGALSLVANVAAGENLGYRMYGGLLVGGFVLAEWFSGRLHAAPAPVLVTVDDATAAKRRAAALKGAATRKANRAKATRKPRAPKPTPVPAPADATEIEAAYAMAAAE